MSGLIKEKEDIRVGKVEIVKLDNPSEVCHVVTDWLRNVSTIWNKLELMRWPNIHNTLPWLEAPSFYQALLSYGDIERL